MNGITNVAQTHFVKQTATLHTAHVTCHRNSPSTVTKYGH